MNIFTYGSLMFAPVWAQVVSGRYRGESALLQGFRRLSVRGETFPGLWPGPPEETVEGVLYRGISAADLVRLDEFEGDYYCRQWVNCRVGRDQEREVRAGVYVFRPECQGLLTQQPWDPAEFEREGMRRFLSGYAGVGASHHTDQ